jgi:hypothetical protein
MMRNIGKQRKPHDEMLAHLKLRYRTVASVLAQLTRWLEMARINGRRSTFQSGTGIKWLNLSLSPVLAFIS